MPSSALRRAGSSLARSDSVPTPDSPTVRSGTPGSTNPRIRSAVPDATRPLPIPGDRLDVFVLEESIGVGGMGAVFRARDTRLERDVALKVLPPEQAGDPEVVQRFYQEGRAAARLDHENIARVYTIGHDDEIHFIAFEYIEGTTIRHRVERGGPLTPAEAINYTLQIANALIHASERGVVHRDIKPSNIIVTAQGRAKLVDMGLARRFERGRDDGLTQSGMTLGTFDYISPEQARDPRDVDVRSDLYSLGCTLFHMLAGRPPFPDGTVLQKLIQHQEEPPPRIRDLNPAVPPELAAILSKLMAKERERRYQTPEALLRELSVVAGMLGLRSLSPEGLIWAAPTSPPAWERHLIWGVPALGLLIVVGLISWWSADSSTSTAPSLSAVQPKITLIEPTTPVTSTETTVISPVIQVETRSPEPEITRISSEPKVITARSGEDLGMILSSATGALEVILADDERPYALGGLIPRAPLGRRDLVIKAAPGVHPTLRLGREAGVGDLIASPAGLEFVGGKVTLEDLEFVVEGSRSDAIRVTDTELTIRRCIFRREGSATNLRSRGAAIHWRGGKNHPDRPVALTLTESHIGAGQAGVIAVGPIDLTVRDCTLGGVEPAVWLDNPESSSVAAEVRFSHVSLLGSSTSPAFLFQGAKVRVRADDCIFAGGRDVLATLVSIDDPDKLDWRGRSNLYARVSTYLKPSRGRGTSTRDFGAWRGDDETRELDSIANDQTPWKSVDPQLGLADPDRVPTLAFELSPALTVLPGVGTRKGPFSSLERTIVVVGTDPKPIESEPVPAESAPVLPMPMPLSRVGMPDPVDVGPLISNPALTGPIAKIVEMIKPTKFAAPAISDAPIRTVGQMLDAIGRTGTRGGVLLISADADWELPASFLIKAEGLWTLRAEPGATRPRLRFRPDRAPKANQVGSAWPVAIRVRSNLRLEGIDLVLAETDAPVAGPWAAFGVWAGSELSLVRCTVTLQGESKPTAMVTVPSGGVELEPGIPQPELAAAALRISESFIRVGGDLVDVGPGHRLDLEIENAVIATGGTLIHGHGQPRGVQVEPIRLTLRQSTARAQGGLVHLESAIGEPELPVVDVTARDSLVATSAGGDPLFRVDGQENIEALRDRIKWEGHAVAYDQIETYQRDQTAQPGSMPSLYRRSSWEVKVGLKDTAPMYGPYLKPWPGDRPVWSMKIDDVRIPAESAAASAGPDLVRVPNPPLN